MFSFFNSGFYIKIFIKYSSFVVTYGFLQTHGQINHGHVGGGDAEGHASQLAVKHKTDSRRCHKPDSRGSEQLVSLQKQLRVAGTDPFSSGITLPTALAAPVEAGMMFWLAPRPSLHSLPEGPSTVFWVAVMA